MTQLAMHQVKLRKTSLLSSSSSEPSLSPLLLLSSDEDSFCWAAALAFWGGAAATSGFFASLLLSLLDHPYLMYSFSTIIVTASSVQRWLRILSFVFVFVATNSCDTQHIHRQDKNKSAQLLGSDGSSNGMLTTKSAKRHLFIQFFVSLACASYLYCL